MKLFREINISLICQSNSNAMRITFTLLFILIAAAGWTQDLTGIWRGHFRPNDGADKFMGSDDRYKFEVQIAQHNNVFDAVTYSYKSTVFYGKAEANGTLNPKTLKVLLREQKIVEVKMASFSDACSMTCFLQYTKLGDEEFLEGTYSSMNIRDSSNCGKGSIFLHKVASSDFYTEPFLLKREKETKNDRKPGPTSPASVPHAPTAGKAAPSGGIAKAKEYPKKPAPASGVVHSGQPKASVSQRKAPEPRSVTPNELAATNPDKAASLPKPKDSAESFESKKPLLPTPQVLSNRKNELVKTITVNTNEVELNIYDDGAIDHDTVSVYLDKKLVVSHAMLTDRAIVVKIHLDDTNDYHELVMVADNEGDIPPNTSLMVVKAGDKQYEVRIVSTEQKNATVIFKYEKSK